MADTEEPELTMTESLFHIRDIRVAEAPAPSPRAELHRELGRALAELNEQVLRLDASEEALRGYIEQAQLLKSAMAAQGQRDYSTTLRRLLDGEGTGDDVTDLVDFEILTGKASPLSPPLELWLEGDKVKGRGTFGLAFQGPPGRLHGGVLGLALDILLAKTQDFVEQIGVTGTLKIRYLAGTPILKPVEFEARLVRMEGRKLMCEGSVWVDGQQTVAAEGIWISPRGDYRLKPEYAELEAAIRA